MLKPGEAEAIKLWFRTSVVGQLLSGALYGLSAVAAGSILFLAIIAFIDLN